MLEWGHSLMANGGVETLSAVSSEAAKADALVDPNVTTARRLQLENQ